MKNFKIPRPLTYEDILSMVESLPPPDVKHDIGVSQLMYDLIFEAFEFRPASPVTNLFAADLGFKVVVSPLVPDFYYKYNDELIPFKR